MAHVGKQLIASAFVKLTVKPQLRPERLQVDESNWAPISLQPAKCPAPKVLRKCEKVILKDCL